jgi:hypothetical protein
VFENPYTNALISGTLIWNDGDTATVTANKEYGWTFIPENTANYEQRTGKVTPYTPSDSNSGGNTGGGVKIPDPEIPLEETPYNIPGVKSITTPEDKDPIIGSDGSVTLPDGGTIITMGDSKIEVPGGTIIKNDGTVILPNGKVNGAITNEDETVIKVGPGLSIRIPNNATPTGSANISWFNPFIDVLENHWFYSNVLFTFTRGLTTGTSANTFSPNGTLTRGMLVTILYRETGEPDISGLDNPFSDIGNTYYTNAIIWAAKNGIVEGYGDGTFGPNRYITRQFLALILMRYANFMKCELPSIRPYNVFADNNKIAIYTTEAIRVLYEAGVINGKEKNMFDPQGSATRAETSAMLHRFLELVG